MKDLDLWKRIENRRVPLSFDLEITARCNNNCRHCYINLPAGDQAARSQELSLTELSRIADEAVELGALWCLLTGGEPLLRADFPDIYLTLKRKGLLVGVFTNATLLTDAHVQLFRRYPPRDIEVTVYGATAATFESVTRTPGSFAAFRCGVDRLAAAGIPFRLKAMALRSNLQEMAEVAGFSRRYTKDYYRFDPQLHLRFDGDPQRNLEIISERLGPNEIVRLEQEDPERSQALQQGCDKLILSSDVSYDRCIECERRETCSSFEGLTRLIACGAGNRHFVVGYDGLFRICSSLCAPGTVYDLRQGNLREAWESVAPRVRALRCEDPDLLRTCRSCPLVNLCLWCPAHAYLETGRMDVRVDYFCSVAHARAEAIQGARGLSETPADGATGCEHGLGGAR
jgi:radical SAM protein with 4Fe4S-binding SPASM domain